MQPTRQRRVLIPARRQVERQDQKEALRVEDDRDDRKTGALLSSFSFSFLVSVVPVSGGVVRL